MNGRTACRVPRSLYCAVALQWSPPLNGGTTSKLYRKWPIVSPLQWSPPMNGGTTRAPLARDADVERAAMEPADERRDDLRGGRARSHCSSSPQWSPPMNGGTTTRACSWIT